MRVLITREDTVSGNAQGGQKTAAINKAKDPDYYKKLGQRGGLAPKTKPFGFGSMDALKHKEISAKGGANGKRPKWSPEEYKARAAAYAKRNEEQ